MRGLLIALGVLCVVDAAVTRSRSGRVPSRPASSPRRIQERFQQLTADRLRVDREFSDGRETILDPTASFTERSGLYGSYSFRVYKDARTAKAESAEGFEDAPVKPVDGLYWIQYPGDDSWEARRVFPNFLLYWEAPDERKVTDERWDRLVRVAEAMAADGELPEEDFPCDQVGIDPAKGKEGTCKLGGQLLVVVNRGNRRETPGVYAQIERVEQGEQMFARVRMTNSTEQEIVNPFIELAVGGRRFKQSPVAFRFMNDFPLAGGETGTATVVYDVPKPLGERAVDEDDLLLPGDEDQFITVPDATALGRLRLSR